MIQRIQSLYLLLAFACTMLSFKYSFYSGITLDAETNTRFFITLNAFSHKSLEFIGGCLEAACLIAIIMYKIRMRQLLVVSILAIVAIINIVLYIYYIRSFVEGQYSITSIVTFLIPLFLLLAARGIWKDEQLVKSADRLR